MRRILEEVRIREGTAARCTKVIKRRVLKKQTRKARTDHLVKCSAMQGKKRMEIKPMKELHVNCKFSEDREQWNHEPQRHCEQVFQDPEETKEVQEGRIEYFKRKGEQQITMCGRGAEITIDMVLEAVQKCRITKSTDQKTPLQATSSNSCFKRSYTSSQSVSWNQMEAPSSWKIVKTDGFYENPDVLE